MSGNRDEYRILRNMVNRESKKLKFEFYQKHILAISESGSRDWWKNMKKIMGLNGNSNSDMEELSHCHTGSYDCLIVRSVAIWRTCDRSAMFATIASSDRILHWSFFLVVGHRTIGRTRGRAINNDWRRSYDWWLP